MTNAFNGLFTEEEKIDLNHLCSSCDFTFWKMDTGLYTARDEEDKEGRIMEYDFENFFDKVARYVAEHYPQELDEEVGEKVTWDSLVDSMLAGDEYDEDDSDDDEGVG